MDTLIDSVRAYVRIAHNGVPVYVQPQLPDWFVPDSRTDAALQMLQQSGPLEAAVAADRRAVGSAPLASRLLLRIFLERFEGRLAAPYAGRAAYHRLDRLRECWFHLTNRCNMSCAHCI